MQMNDLPFINDPLLAKANNIYRAKYCLTRSTSILSIRWLSCCPKRPNSSLCDSKEYFVPERSRIDSLWELFNEYMKHVIEHNIESIGMRWDPSRRAGKKS